MLGILVLFCLLYCLKKIAYIRVTIIGSVVLAAAVSVAFYVVNVQIAKCVAFYGGWDCGMVANSARWVFEGGEMGYGDYYSIYTNNVPITWLLYRLYSYTANSASYPYNPEFVWIQFQCAQRSVAVFCGCNHADDNKKDFRLHPNAFVYCFASWSFSVEDYSLYRRQ